MTRILVLDDQHRGRSALQAALDAQRYDVDAVSDRNAALDRAVAYAPDVLVLDLTRPQADGVDTIQRFRRRTSAPIIILSGRVRSVDKIAALDAGADDYLTKPFDLGELLARIRAIVRRRLVVGTPGREVHVGRYTVDLDASTVRTTEGGQRVKLSPIQWRLLQILLAEPNRVVPHERLLCEVWGPQYASETAYLRQYMIQLRRKLEDNPAKPRHLINEAGRGYSFHP